VNVTYRQALVFFSGLFFGGLWCLMFRLAYKNEFSLIELSVYLYALGITFVGMEDLCCASRSKDFYANIYMKGCSFYGINIRQETYYTSQQISEMVNPVKIPLISILTITFAIISTLSLNALGYDREHIDFSNPTKYEPMYFFGSLVAIAQFLYKMGQLIMQSVIERIPELLVELGARSRFKRHEIENEIVLFLESKDRYEQSLDTPDWNLDAEDVSNLKENKALLERLKASISEVKQKRDAADSDMSFADNLEVLVNIQLGRIEAKLKRMQKAKNSPDYSDEEIEQFELDLDLKGTQSEQLAQVTELYSDVEADDEMITPQQRKIAPLSVVSYEQS